MDGPQPPGNLSLADFFRVTAETEPKVAERFVYMPIVHTGKPVSGQNGPDYNALAITLAHAIRTHPQQQRSTLVWDTDIARVARIRAEDMCKRSYIAHTNPDGDGPNRVLERNGVQLPNGYSTGQTANNIESIRLGPLDIDDCVAALIKSTGHRAHVMGENWYGGQRRIGVGVGPDWNLPPLQWIFVILTLHD